MGEEVFSFKEIKYDNLVNDGVTFDVNNIQDSLDEILKHEEDDDEEIDPDEFRDPLKIYNQEPFNILWDKMTPLDKEDKIRKVIVKKGIGEPLKDNCRIKILYCGYFDGQEKPFISTGIKSPESCNLQDSGYLTGLEMAIKSMLVGEHARFLIHHSLMFGDLGCPPHIPKKAMCLQHIILLSATLEDDIPEELFDALPTLSNIFAKAKKEFNIAIRHYDVGEFKNALIHFNEALNTTLSCRLVNAYDENEQRKFLKKIYLNLAICYNKIKLPQKTCIMCNEYIKISNINRDWKMLFQNGKALRVLNNFDLARKRLSQALKLHPDCEEIKKEIKLLNQQIKATADYEVQLSNFMNKVENVENNSNGENKEETRTFKDEVELLCLSFETDNTLNTLDVDLPIGLSHAELETFKDVVKSKKFLIEIKNVTDSKRKAIISKVVEEKCS